MIDIKSLLQLALYLIGIGVVYGTIQSKLNQFDNEIKKINSDIKDIKNQLGNHIQHISDDIRQICERLARMEGKINGR